VIEKKILPSAATMSDSTFSPVSGAPLGERTFAKALKTSSLLTAMIVPFRRLDPFRGLVCPPFGRLPQPMQGTPPRRT